MSVSHNIMLWDPRIESIAEKLNASDKKEHALNLGDLHENTRFDYFNPIKGIDSQNLPSAMSQDFDFDIQTIDPSPANPPDQIGPSGNTCLT